MIAHLDQTAQLRWDCQSEMGMVNAQLLLEAVELAKLGWHRGVGKEV